MLLPSNQLSSLEKNGSTATPHPTKRNCERAETSKLVIAKEREQVNAERVKVVVAKELLKHQTPKTQADKSKNAKKQSAKLEEQELRIQYYGKQVHPKPKFTKEQQKEDDRIWFAMLATFSCSKAEKVSFQTRRLLDCFLKTPWWTTESVVNKHYSRLETRARKGDHDCVIHGGRKCFCWKFEYEGKWRAHNFRNGWVGVRTPFVPAEDQHVGKEGNEKI